LKSNRSPRPGVTVPVNVHLFPETPRLPETSVHTRPIASPVCRPTSIGVPVDSVVGLPVAFALSIACWKVFLPYWPYADLPILPSTSDTGRRDICRTNAGRSCRRPFAWVNLSRFRPGLTMRLLIAISGLAALLASAAHADTPQNCAAAWQNMPNADRGDMTQREWSAKCLKPTYSIGEYGAPGYAIAICKDGHFSRRKKTPHRCSHHGRVAKYL